MSASLGANMGTANREKKWYREQSAKSFGDDKKLLLDNASKCLRSKNQL